MATAPGSVNLIINNQSGNDNIWIQWTGMGSLTGTSSGTTGLINIAPSDYNNNAAGYLLTDFQSAGTNQYLINDFSMAGGRMWFTYGNSGFTFHNTGYTPALATFGDPNFTRRYDKIEASITGSTDDTINMTALDGFSIPFQVTGYNSNNIAGTTRTLSGSTTDVIVNALSAIAANPSAPAPAGGYPHVTSASPYLVINNNSQGLTSSSPYQYSPVTSTGSFVRVIGNDQVIAPLGGTYSDPVVAANSGVIPANYQYKQFDKYLSKMDGTGTQTFSGTTTIKGLFSGLGTGATTDAERKQTYNLTATFSATEQMTMTNPVTGGPTTYTGVVTLTGTTTLQEGPNAGQTKNVIVKIPYEQLLTPAGVVGANAGYRYSYDGGTTWSDTGTVGPLDNIFTWVEGDLLAGMNIGTVGSEKIIPGTITLNGHTYTNAKVGEIDSQDWFYLGQALAQPGESVYDYYYGYLQSSADYYNEYSAALYGLTDAYGYAYGERIQGGSVAISWDATQSETAMDTIIITILPDVVPEPGTVGLAVCGVGLALFAARRRLR